MGHRQQDIIHLSLLRGICQMPGYLADAKHFFRRQGLDVRIANEPTAWVLPQRFLRGEIEFAVMPWTRVDRTAGACCPVHE